jgi:prepilin-type N-terminal cleavage/methylation domain-containing protein
MINCMLFHSHIARSQSASTARGFSLIEMAIVLFIVALLLGGLLPTVSGQIEQTRRSDTRKQLDEIQQALIGYALTNGRLPCPADSTTPSGQVNGLGVAAGAEYKNPVAASPYICANIAGSSAWGVLPWATLGVNETDAWGRRFTYSVTATFADSTDGTACVGTITIGTSFQLCSSGTLSILSAFGGTNIGANIPAVIISHGTNGLGGYTSAGQQIQPVPVANDEGENTDANTNFVSHTFTSTFDDLVVWISPNILINRMVTTGRLP